MKKIKSIMDLKLGEQAKIVGFNSGDNHYRDRLMALGFIPDSIITIIRKAPLGDPIEVHLNTFSSRSAFCLRKKEALILQLETVEDLETLEDLKI